MVHFEIGDSEGIVRVRTWMQGMLVGVDTAVGDGANIGDVHLEGVASRHKQVGETAGETAAETLQGLEHGLGLPNASRLNSVS